MASTTTGRPLFAPVARWRLTWTGSRWIPAEDLPALEARQGVILQQAPAWYPQPKAAAAPLQRPVVGHAGDEELWWSKEEEQELQGQQQQEQQLQQPPQERQEQQKQHRPQEQQLQQPFFRWRNSWPVQQPQPQQPQRQQEQQQPVAQQPQQQQQLQQQEQLEQHQLNPMDLAAVLSTVRDRRRLQWLSNAALGGIAAANAGSEGGDSP